MTSIALVTLVSLPVLAQTGEAAKELDCRALFLTFLFFCAQHWRTNITMSPRSIRACRSMRQYGYMWVGSGILATKHRMLISAAPLDDPSNSRLGHLVPYRNGTRPLTFTMARPTPVPWTLTHYRRHLYGPSSWWPTISCDRTRNDGKNHRMDHGCSSRVGNLPQESCA